MSEVLSDMMMTACGWCGGITVALAILAASHGRRRTALLFALLSVPLGLGVLYLIFGGPP